MIDIEVTGDAQVAARIRATYPALHTELARAVAASAFRLHSLIVNGKLSGQLLKRRTGALAASITMEATADEAGLQARVGNLTKSVVYARIHEYGGQTAPHVIEARRAKALYFNGRFFRRVNHPGSAISEKRFLRGSLDEKRAEFLERIEAAIQAAVGRA